LLLVQALDRLPQARRQPFDIIYIAVPQFFGQFAVPVKFSNGITQIGFGLHRKTPLVDK
jgi:hypothetical protein